MVAYAALKGKRRNKIVSPIAVFPIEQPVALGAMAAKALLPSLRYHPAAGEVAALHQQLPWAFADPGAVAEVIFGELAQQQGARAPGRLVASAKSWLSHSGVDRTAPILPWGAADDVEKVSALAASASYLAYVRSAWNQQFPKQPLETQEVILTVPASFDEAARALTIEAARLAGLPELRLLEEPQAACYDWLYRHSEDAAAAFGDTRLLLVCDVGGGTTDLTLIAIAHHATGLQLTRVGVGDHLILGGDNMDLTLARAVEAQFGERRLNAGELSQLLQQCRSAKERLLAATAPERTSVTLLGSGTRLIGAARSATLHRAQAQALLVDGFLPRISSAERPQARRAAIIEFGLPYVADPAITRHLAAFLGHHGDAARHALAERAPQDAPAMPEAVLLNGGIFHSPVLAGRLLDTLGDWRGQPVQRLDNPEPDLAVARGAVAYGLARRGHGWKIGGGSARSYFLRVDGADGSKQGICLLPRGTEEGQELRLDRTFSLRLGAPVQFHLLSSNADTSYMPGALVSLESPDLTALPPVATVIDGAVSGETAVQLVTQLTEVGTLEVDCVAVTPLVQQLPQPPAPPNVSAAEPLQRWRLAFELRGADSATLTRLHAQFPAATAQLERFYGARSAEVDGKEIKGLRGNLERLLGSRETWETALLRELFQTLWQGARRRRRSASHERLWFNLVGYCLRPGCGYPLDAWRVGQLWSVYEQGIHYAQDAQNSAEWWTLWRRVAGGLDALAQVQLSEDVLRGLRIATGKAAQEKSTNTNIEGLAHLAGGLERLAAARKVELGELLLKRLERKGTSAQLWWAIGRIGARIPAYASAHDVIPTAIAAGWLERVCALDWKATPNAAFAATLLARMSGDRERDIEESLRQQVLQRLQAAKAPSSWLRLVMEVVELDEADRGRVFGEALPPGLRLLGLRC